MLNRCGVLLSLIFLSSCKTPDGGSLASETSPKTVAFYIAGVFGENEAIVQLSAKMDLQFDGDNVRGTFNSQVLTPDPAVGDDINVPVKGKVLLKEGKTVYSINDDGADAGSLITLSLDSEFKVSSAMYSNLPVIVSNRPFDKLKAIRGTYQIPDLKKENGEPYTIQFLFLADNPANPTSAYLKDRLKGGGMIQHAPSNPFDATFQTEGKTSTISFMTISSDGHMNPRGLVVVVASGFITEILYQGKPVANLQIQK